MSLFRVNVVTVNPKDEARTSASVAALVESGSVLSWLPAEALAAAGIAPHRSRSFQTATKQVISRLVGYAILRAEGFETIDEVVFGEPGDMSLLGVRTIEGFGVIVDYIGHRFVVTTTIVAAVR